MTASEIAALHRLSDEWRTEAKEIERIAGNDGRDRADALRECALTVTQYLADATVTDDTPSNRGGLLDAPDRDEEK